MYNILLKNVSNLTHLRFVLVFFFLFFFSRESWDRVHARYHGGGCGQRHQPVVQGGPALVLRVWQVAATARSPSRLGVGRLWRQHRLRLPVRQAVRRRKGNGDEPAQEFSGVRQNENEPTQQWSREKGTLFCPPQSQIKISFKILIIQTSFLPGTCLVISLCSKVLKVEEWKTD